MRNIYAYTPNTNPYPEFVSLNRKDNGSVTLTVREGARRGQFSDKDCGNVVEVILPEEELSRLREALQVDISNQMARLMG